jgi:hypothetical protein
MGARQIARRGLPFFCFRTGKEGSVVRCDDYASFMLPTSLLGQLDQRARARGQNRSNALREAVVCWLQATGDGTELVVCIKVSPPEPGHAAEQKKMPQR